MAIGNDNANSSSVAKSSGSGSSMMTNKVVFRHLPPTLSVEDFLATVSPLPEHRYFQYCKADYNAGAEAAYCRAYIGLRRLDDVYSICSRWDGYEFSDPKGYMYPALVEFSPNQRIPDRTSNGSYQFLVPDQLGFPNSAIPTDPSLGKKPKKTNTLKGTLLDDEDFKIFCDRLAASKSTIIPSSSTQIEPTLGTDAMLREIEERHKNDESMSKKKSPLIEFLEQRRRGNEAKRILAKAAKAGKIQAEKEQKKKRKDRKRLSKREREQQTSGDSNAPVIGSVKIATKPASTIKTTSDANRSKESKKEERKEDDHPKGHTSRPQSDQKKSRRPQSAKDETKQGSRFQQSKQSKQRSEDQQVAKTPGHQNFKFIDTADDDNHGYGEQTFKGGNRQQRRQTSGGNPNSRLAGGDKQHTPRGKQDDAEKSTNSEDVRSSSATKTSQRPVRTMVFSRSLAAAVSSSGASGRQAVRFDPRKAPPPPGGKS